MYSEQSYHLLFESNPLPMWVYDLATLQFLAVNSAAMRNYGYSREEFLSMTIKEIRPPEDIPSLLEEVARLKNGFNNSEGRHTKKDGTVIDVELRSHSLQFADRQAELVLAIDITERKRAEAEHLELVREQAARAQSQAEQRRLKFLSEASAVLSSSLDYKIALKSVARLAVPTLADLCLIDLLDDNGRMNRVEVACADPSKRHLARNLKKYPPDLNRREVPVTQAIETRRLVFLPEIVDAMYVQTAANEEHLEIKRALGATSLVTAPLMARHHTLGAMSFAMAQSARHYSSADLSLIEELSKRTALAIDNAKLYYEAQLANRAKDDFLATVSHELRTPLTSVLIWTRMLASGKADSVTYDQALNSIGRSVNTLSTLVDDLLDMSRIVADRLRINLCQVDLNSIINSAFEVVQPSAEAKQIQVALIFDESIKPVRGDPDRLQQVIWNLLSNAITFTDQNGRVELRTENAGSEVSIVVTDDGVGISPEFLPYVFDRFKQDDSSDRRRHRGMGLGLTIVRHLVELHGGTVTAASDGIGKGSTFTVRLPMNTATDSVNDSALDTRGA